MKPTGIFTLAGPLSVFIARKVCLVLPRLEMDGTLIIGQNIPSDIKWEPNTVPPQYTDHADQVIEKGTSLRLKILGVKPDVAAINAIGTIKEDYLGSVVGPFPYERFLLTQFCPDLCNETRLQHIPTFYHNVRGHLPFHRYGE